MWLKGLTVLLISIGLLACARSNVHDTRGDPDTNYFFTDIAPYQIGSEMGKKPVSQESLGEWAVGVQRVARATARIQNETAAGTAFYLGKFAGSYIMATNNHVYKDAEHCLGRAVVFPLLDDRSFSCQSFVGSWADIDLALFAVDVPEVDETLMASVSSNFDFGVGVRHGEELITFGFGKANNPNRQMMVNEDSDCRVFSGDDEFRYMNDPDQILPDNKKTWSFSHGCDVSHGDSGSAMIDRVSGGINGILWSGAVPKDPRVRDEEFLKSVFDNRSDEVWTLLSYAVPAKKIGEFLKRIKESPDTPEATRRVLRELLPD
jgi:hypothetical protein